jgi:2-keto-4-pentenoate hydratase
MTKYKGSVARARLNNVLANHLIADFAANGGEVVARLRKDKPVEYLKMVTAILQQQAASETAQAPEYNVVERRIVYPPARSDG